VNILRSCCLITSTAFSYVEESYVTFANLNSIVLFAAGTTVGRISASLINRVFSLNFSYQGQFNWGLAIAVGAFAVRQFSTPNSLEVTMETAYSPVIQGKKAEDRALQLLSSYPQFDAIKALTQKLALAEKRYYAALFNVDATFVDEVTNALRRASLANEAAIQLAAQAFLSAAKARKLKSHDARDKVHEAAIFLARAGAAPTASRMITEILLCTGACPSNGYYLFNPAKDIVTAGIKLATINAEACRACSGANGFNENLYAALRAQSLAALADEYVIAEGVNERGIPKKGTARMCVDVVADSDTEAAAAIEAAETRDAQRKAALAAEQAAKAFHDEARCFAADVLKDFSSQFDEQLNRSKQPCQELFERIFIEANNHPETKDPCFGIAREFLAPVNLARSNADKVFTEAHRDLYACLTQTYARARASGISEQIARSMIEAERDRLALDHIPKIQTSITDIDEAFALVETNFEAFSATLSVIDSFIGDFATQVFAPATHAYRALGTEIQLRSEAFFQAAGVDEGEAHTRAHEVVDQVLEPAASASNTANQILIQAARIARLHLTPIYLEERSRGASPAVARDYIAEQLEVFIRTLEPQLDSARALALEAHQFIDTLIAMHTTLPYAPSRKRDVCRSSVPTR